MTTEFKKPPFPSPVSSPPTNDPINPRPRHPGNSSALEKARRSADRIIEIEDTLVRKIIGQFEIDRQLQQLLVELHICSTRMQEQLNECSHAPATDEIVDTRSNRLSD